MRDLLDNGERGDFTPTFGLIAVVFIDNAIPAAAGTRAHPAAISTEVDAEGKVEVPYALAAETCSTSSGS